MKNKSGVKCDCFARKNKGNLMQQSLLLDFGHCLSLSALSYVSKIYKILSPQFLQDSFLYMSCVKLNYILSKFSFSILQVEVIDPIFYIKVQSPRVICLSKSCPQCILLVGLLCQTSFLKYVCRWTVYFLPII